MLNRFGLGLECASHVIILIAVISYATRFADINEPFYRVDVDYVKWVTNLPAFSVCPTVRRSHVAKQLKRLLNTTGTEVVQFARELTRPARKHRPNYDSDSIRRTFKDNFKALTEYLTEPCENILLECSWNGEPFQCCRHFQRIHTEEGTCLSLNSAHAKEPDSTPGYLTTSFSKPKAELSLEVAAPVRVYVHDRKSLDFWAVVPVRVIKTRETADIVYKFLEWGEDSDSWYLPRHERNCTLSGETSLSGFAVYSRSACRMRCRAVRQHRMCGCKHHLLPGPERDCDLDGLACLDEETGSEPQQDDCDCLEECSRVEVTYVRYGIERYTGRTSKILVSLSGPPTERIILTSRFTPISLVVTIACCSRLLTHKTIHELIRDSYHSAKALCTLVCTTPGQVKKV